MPTFTPTPTHTPTKTPSPTATSTNTPTPAPTKTLTPTITPVERLNPPQNLRAEAATSFAITLHWLPPQGEEETKNLSYHILWWPGGAWAFTESTTYQIEALLPKSRYLFLVIAVDGVRVSAGAIVSGTTLALPIAWQTATPSPPPLPTPLPDDMVILSLMSHRSYEDDLGALQVVGEVRNDLEIGVDSAEIRAVFYDYLDKPLFEQRVALLLPRLSPGERAPFRIDLASAENAATYSLQATAQIAEQAPPPSPALTQSWGEQDQAGFYHVEGQVANLTGQTILGARAVITLYDFWGNIVNADLVYISPFQLEAGELGNFDCVFEHFPGVESHAVLIASY